MSGLDAIVLVIIGFFAWMGFKNGLVREVLGILGVVLALFIGFKYAEPATNWFNTESIEGSQYLLYFTFFILFIVVLIFVRLTIFFLEEFLSVLLLTIPNRIMGGIFGVLKSMLYLSIAFIILDAVEIPEQKTRNSSITYNTVMAVAPHAYNFVAFFYPGAESYYDGVHQKFDELKAGTSQL